MVKANKKTRIANPLSLAFILFRQAYVKIQDLIPKDFRFTINVILLMLAVLTILLVAVPARAATFTVDSTADTADATAGNGVCATTGGVCTLRAAIQESNALAGADTINFNIPSTDTGYQTSGADHWWRITPATALPTITGAGTVIDGTTQTTNQGNTNSQGPEIEIRGSASKNGFKINSNNNTIRGLIINGFLTSGYAGIMIDDAVAGLPGPSGNTIAGNYIGTDYTGTAALANYDAIRTKNGANNNTIGGTTAADRNILSGNTCYGIWFQSISNQNTVIGNYIGTDVTGTIARPNGSHGIAISSGSASNHIGGTTASERNIISGNTGNGVSLSVINTDYNVISGNYIGTNATGTAAIPNGGIGVQIRNSLTDTNGGRFNVIGGTTPGERNIISGNGAEGVLIWETGTNNNIVKGNYIGTDVNGTTAIPNGSYGVRIAYGANNNTVGGTGSGESNIIAFNSNNGVYVVNNATSTIGNIISGNSIFSNTNLGIDIGTAGVGTGTNGANNDKPMPTISSITPSGANFIVTATVTSGDTIEFFRVNNAASPAVTVDPTGYGEGYLYLGSCVDNGACSGPYISAVADADAAAGTVQATLLSGGLSGGDYVTATATDATNGTSEFSANYLVTVTAVDLISFIAVDYHGDVFLRWQTGYEVDNLGFHVYSEENGELYRLTPELIAGSALLAGSGTTLTAGRHYTWWDFLPEETGHVQYWLEDIDLNGKRTMHGPVEIKPLAISGQQSTLKHGQAKFLSELGMRLEKKYREYWRIQELRERLSLKRSATTDRGALRSRIASLEEGSILEARGASPQGNFVPAPSSSRPKAAPLSSRQEAAPLSSRQEAAPLSSRQEAALQAQQWFLASSPAVKISVKEEGLYRITQPELVAAGLNSRINPRYLQLFVDGKEQPIRVTGEKDGRFDPQDAIEFYGVGLDNPSTDTRVYWLVAVSRPGKRIHLFKGRGGQLSPESFPYTVEKKDRTIYFAALKNGDEDNFFGPVVAGEPVDQLMSVLHLSSAPPGEAVLEVALQGATNVPHRIKVLVNETEVGEVVFDGQAPGTAGFTIPQALLLEGDNLVSLIAQGGEMDVSVVDYIRLTYWHTYTADDDALKFTVQGGKQLSINGFSNPDIRVMDITNLKDMYEVAGNIKSYGTDYFMTFRVPGYGQRTLLAFTDDRVKNPVGIAANRPSSWNQSSGYDLVIISHRDFLQGIEPLKKLRQSQGLTVALIDIEDLYDEFSYGAKSPQALRDFLSLAKKQWYKPPRFVLLVGDASFDPRNYLGFGDLDFVPTKLIDTAYLETASDDWFADFNGDGLPEMAVGRLPVRTTEEANTVISKITGYERSAPIMEALLVADKNDGFNFEGATEEVGALLQPHVSIREIFRGNFSSDAAAKAELLSSIDQGPLFVNYTGHGSVEIWRGNILTSDDADGLINGMRLPFVVSMTCLNGFFHDLYTESLAEALLKARQGGAMAVWASSGLTEPDGQNLMDKELIRLLFNGNSLTIGEATAKAKAAVSDQDIRRTWILFGDPAMRLRY